MKTAYSIVASISGNISRCGYAYIATATDHVLRCGIHPGDLMHRIYPAVAEEHKTSVKLAARNIARAVEDLWDFGDRDALEKIAGHKLAAKPSPGELIVTIANYMIGNADAL